VEEFVMWLICILHGHGPFARVVQFWSAGGGLDDAETPGRACCLCGKFEPMTWDWLESPPNR
jgi:hypothetical protein